MTTTLLVVDDEPEICAFIGDVAEEMGFDVAVATDADQFWSAYFAVSPDVIVLDLKMPEVDGIELLRVLGHEGCGAHILLASGTDSRILDSARRLGATHGLKMLGVLRKPIAVADLKDMLARTLKREEAIAEQALRQALAEDRIIVHFQPKADLASDRNWRIVACEALARWDHPELGLLGPETFVPMAEEANLIQPLTDRVLRQSIAELARWQAEGLSLSAAVNLSPRLLNDVDLPDRCHEICQSAGIEPSRMVLEITESAAMKDVAASMDILTRLRLKDFGLSLDDFGTGYSSLAQLHRLPFNEMKIDKSFVIESDEDAEAAKIVRSIAGLAHNLGLSLCAEGVETEQALALVCDVGCRSAQGFLIGRPMPATEFLAFVRGAAVAGSA